MLHLTSLLDSNASKSLVIVSLKIMNEFQPGKTQLCITSAASSIPASANKSSCDSSSLNTNVISKSRTLKVMRTALAGLPILTPEWIEACLKEGHIIPPSGAMCIRTLPMKGSKTRTGASDIDKNSTESFGVAKYAAIFQEAFLSSHHGVDMSLNRLLSGVSVLLCGDWKMTGAGMKKDLKLLLHEMGATIMSSVSVASQTLSEISRGDSAFRAIVFLCDDSHSNKDCGISDTLFKEAKLAILSKNGDVLAVHFNWLFDCISCATMIPATSYEPLAPRAKELWNLSCDDQAD